MSSISSSASLLPSPSVSIPAIASGNLLSNVPPPAALPSFIAAAPQLPPSTRVIAPPTQTGAIKKVDTPIPVAVPLQSSLTAANSEPFYPTQFR